MLPTASTTSAKHEEIPRWLPPRYPASEDKDEKEESAADLAIDVMCKMVALLDGAAAQDFSRQLVEAGGLQCLVEAMVFGDAERSRNAQQALLHIRDKLPSNA